MEIASRARAIAAVVAIVGTSAFAVVRDADAAAEVHRLNLVLSANPTQVSPDDFNDSIDQFNRAVLTPRGLKGIERISFAWLYQAELQYFVRNNIAVTAGVGQLRSHSSREFLPALGQDIQFRTEILSVPIHVGADYYFTPYNQGDFQARAFLGAALTSLVYNRARFQATEVSTSPVTTLGGTYQISAQGDSPGYFLEAGVHMFFAARFSVKLGVLYRSAMVRRFDAELHSAGRVVPLGEVFELDTSGIGSRAAVAIGF